MARMFPLVRSRRGAVLIVVLGVLVVLSLLAITFAEFSTLDRSIARSYLDGVRAQLVARAGIERAIGEIGGSIERGAYNDPAMVYWGNKPDETGAPDAGASLHRALNPSFSLEKDGDPSNADPRPMEFEIDGQRMGLSGSFKGGTHGENGEVYKLRVVDANSMMHVNDGVSGGNHSSVSRNLERMLDILGMQVGVVDAGKRLVANRPPTGYRSKRELERVLGATDYGRIRNYVTTIAWVDTAVVNPVPLSTETLSVYPIKYNSELGLYRYGRGRAASGDEIKMPMKFAPEFCDPQGVEHSVMALDELNAQWIERAGRAPVNVNVAAKPVLIALLSGLRGFFVAERRKSNPGHGLYQLLWYEKAENMPGGMRGDELGYLYSTPEITGPSGNDGGTTSGAASAGGVNAEQLADELISCRTRQVSPHTGVNYAQVWFGGPFKSWRQFNAFCDGLIDRGEYSITFNYSLPRSDGSGVLRDPRNSLYYDYLAVPTTAGGPHSSDDVSGSDVIVPSKIMHMFAAQAMADVLKANFNPNCTLNELNPDENLHLVVDKTDLICNSTEFCFTPMGYYEVECEGIVLETQDQKDLMTVLKGTTVATKTIACVLKAYDVYRETTQADFYGGEAGFRPGHTPATNNNRTIEIGPEPDNGIAPSQCRWSGWLQLATVGGDWVAPGSTKARNTLVNTEVGRSEHGETLHAHFQYDHDLGFSSAGDSKQFRRALIKNNICRNNPDRTETEPGPYGPTRGQPGQYRLARDWAMEEFGRSTTSDYSGPSDLRVDGAYVERDSACMWTNSLDVFSLVGTVCFWVKPSFQPCLTGKTRTWFTVDNALMGVRINPTQNPNQQKTCAVWFIAGHDRAPFQDPVNEWKFPIYNDGPWRPATVVMGTSEGFGGHGTWTPSLNHRAHVDHKLPDHLKAHGWTHVATQWKMNVDPALTSVRINGEVLPFTSDVDVHNDNWGPEEFLKNGNPIRFGEPSKTWEFQYFWGETGSFTRNWAADVTVDELHLWKGWRLAETQGLFSNGRYYRSAPGYEAIYTSRDLQLGAPSRNLPPPSTTAVPPVASGTQTGPVKSPGGRPPNVTTTDAAPVGQTRIIATFMTFYPQAHSNEGRPMIGDYHEGGASVDSLSSPLPLEIELDFMVNGVAKNHSVLNDGGPVKSLFVSDTDTIKYYFRIRVPEATIDSIFLATPAIDDVTIFHTRGSEYLSYEVQETAM